MVTEWNIRCKLTLMSESVAVTRITKLSTGTFSNIVVVNGRLVNTGAWFGRILMVMVAFLIFGGFL